MEKDADPLLSIVTVNFNGKDFLSSLFDSISNLNYSRDKLQVIMVDNASTDGSVDLVKEKYPWVQIAALKKNTGYAGGNNEGFRLARGKYIALINNDCVVDPDWAREMLAIFRESGDDSKIGAVGSKVVFYFPYLPLELVSDSINQKGRSGHARRLGVKVSKIIIGGQGQWANRSIKYMDGFYPPQGSWQWTNGDGYLGIPIADQDQDLKLQLTLSSCLESNRLKIVIGEELLEEVEVGREEKIVDLTVPQHYYRYQKDIINSCGVKVNHSLYARERGFNSFDEGQYSRVEEVFGLSGSSFIVDRAMLEDTGYFDPDFFTYYEDIDLFWRARLRGWKHFFVPNSVARHYHCGTGREWSYDFTYYVLRNRMLAIFKCGWFSLLARTWLAFAGSMVYHGGYYGFLLLAGRKPNRVDIPIRVKLFFKFFYLFAAYLGARARIRFSAVVKDKQIKKWMRSF
ncbi:MAG: glycosyltransferase family 2 protein [Actinomycetia bacterium]|nr:glycosyltransferase family 2 protein [Actinomycetes bacterium]